MPRIGARTERATAKALRRGSAGWKEYGWTVALTGSYVGESGLLGGNVCAESGELARRFGQKRPTAGEEWQVGFMEAIACLKKYMARLK